MTRICIRCGFNKPLTDFAWLRKSQGKLDPYCRACRKAYHRAHYLRNKKRYIQNAKERRERIHRIRTEWLIAYLRDHPCVECGESDPIVLEFDHVEGTKEFNVGAAFRGSRSWADVVKEIGKCEIVCANCHRKRTSRRGGFLKSLLLGEAEEKPLSSERERGIGPPSSVWKTEALPLSYSRESPKINKRKLPADR